MRSDGNSMNEYNLDPIGVPMKGQYPGRVVLLAIAVLAAAVFAPVKVFAEPYLLNVSYDPTREVFQTFNSAFAKHWKAKTGASVVIRQSHDGSSKQARAVIDGLEADVVTLALAGDIDAIAVRSKAIAPDWQTRLPDHSTPYTSTIVFVVRKGNPKGIKDWGDLAKPGVSVISPNPKTSGGAKWNYLAAWGYVLRKEKGDEARAFEFVKTIFKNAPVLDSGARGSTTTFVQRGIGDVLLAWENEALMITREVAKDDYEIVVPSESILAEPSVALVDKVVEKRGTKELAAAYLEFLYAPEGQEIFAAHYFRPRSAEALAKAQVKFPKLDLFTIDEAFGGWAKAQKAHFDDGGSFDRIFVATAKR